MKEFLPKSAAKMADCLMKRYGLLTSRWSYDYGVAWRGMEALYAMTGEKKYFDYIKDAMDTFVTDEAARFATTRWMSSIWTTSATGGSCCISTRRRGMKSTCGRQTCCATSCADSRAHPTGDSGTKSATPTKCGWMGCICPRRSMWNTA